MERGVSDPRDPREHAVLAARLRGLALESTGQKRRRLFKRARHYERLHFGEEWHAMLVRERSKAKRERRCAASLAS